MSSRYIARVTVALAVSVGTTVALFSYLVEKTLEAQSEDLARRIQESARNRNSFPRVIR